MQRLVCIFVVHMQQRQVFSRSGPYESVYNKTYKMTRELPSDDLWTTQRWPVNYPAMTCELPSDDLWTTQRWPVNYPAMTCELPNNDMWTTQQWHVNYPAETQSSLDINPGR